MSDDPTHRFRQKSARKILSSCELDAFLITNLENIRYLCGFTGSDGALVLTKTASFFLTDSRYWTQSAEEVKEARVVHYRNKVEGIAHLLGEINANQIGFEAPALTVSFHRALSEKLNTEATLRPLEKETRSLRMVKDDQELALMRKAIEIASKAFLNALAFTREGAVEEEIALEMEFFMKRNGSEAIGFDIITASGSRAAFPHGKASKKQVHRGEFILFDYGAKVGGYHSDETRTVICGEPTAEQRRVYQTVKEAHDKAIAMIRPGIPIRDVDAAARDHIRERGYGDYFGHGLGHGVGLAVHEEPAINAENQETLQEGMVFTVEPGIYIPNWGGVRIEDMVRVTRDGAEVLTYLPTDLKMI